MNNATLKAVCTSGYFSLDPHGSSFNVLNAETNEVADGDTPSVVCKALFTEASPEDVLIAAIVQNQSTGIIIDAGTPMLFNYGKFDGIHGMREWYNTYP